MNRFKLPLREGESALDVEKPLPVWFDDVVTSLDRLAELGPNWDSYGAHPIGQSSLSACVELLASVSLIDTPRPAIVPTNRGTVLLEWHLRGIDLEVEVASPERFLVAFEDAVDGTQWEAELDSDLTHLVDGVARLSRVP